jgi:hypothetical protein
LVVYVLLSGSGRTRFLLDNTAHAIMKASGSRKEMTAFSSITCKMLMFWRMNAARLHTLKLSHATFSYCAGRHFSVVALPNVTNEPFLHYAPGSAERSSVLAACKSAREECPDIPLVINGQALHTGDIGRQVRKTRVPFPRLHPTVPSIAPLHSTM